MNKENYYLRGGLVIFALGTLSLSVLFGNQGNKLVETEKQVKTQTHQVDSLQHLVDSLHDDNFALSVEIGRHEITREEIFYTYPKVGKEYQEFYEHKTE
jgi:hypothetical protein